MPSRTKALGVEFLVLTYEENRRRGCQKPCPVSDSASPRATLIALFAGLPWPFRKLFTGMRTKL